MSEPDLQRFKQTQRTIWSAGDYHEVSRPLQQAAEVLVERAGAAPGVRLLDVACGTGNVAVPAALAGASVTGLDLTPDLLARARARAAEEDVSVDWVEGDAEQLPFADDAFDVVTSSFGVIFAPRQQLAASELLRVARPGGRVLLSAWTPEGVNGRMFATIASHMPPAGPGSAPIDWGREEHVRELFDAASGGVVEPAFERRTVRFTHDSAAGWADYSASLLGPLVIARAALEPEGRWQPLMDDLTRLYEQANQAQDGSLRIESEYLLSTIELPR